MPLRAISSVYTRMLLVLVIPLPPLLLPLGSTTREHYTHFASLTHLLSSLTALSLCGESRVRAEEKRFC